MNERMEEATKKIKAEADQRISLIEEEKNAAVQKLEDMEAKLEADRRQLEVTKSELFEVNQTATEKVEAKSAEAELLLDDLENANQRANLAEKEIEHFKEQLSIVRNDQCNADNSR